MLNDICAHALDDGATACAVVDAATGAVLAGEGGGAARDVAAILEVLRSRTPVPSPFDRAPSAGAVDDAREILVVGGGRALFVSLTRRRDRAALLVTPTAMSIALGWSLLRRVLHAAEGR
jgi:hypothetical protein